MVKKRRKMTSAKFLALGYIVVILIGAFLLCLPISSVNREWAPFVKSLFTATSATCVTGLTVYDTFTHFSLFGQIVILFLIQIGGIGFMTVITMFSMFLRRKIGLYERKILMDSEGMGRISGVMLMIKRILIYTLIFELAGAVLLSIRFVGDFGWGRGIYFGIFHSVSAFCNAGFDLMGARSEFSSLTAYVGDPLVCLTVMFLIVVGGLGFIVWGDIFDCRFRFKKFMLHTKIVLIATAVLILPSAVAFFFTEANASMAGKGVGTRILASLFMAITPRTAGFSTVDMAAVSEGGSLLTVILMFIGGNTGSTAGGVKVTTVMVAVLGVIAMAKKDTDAVVTKKRIGASLILQAFSIIFIYIVFIFSAMLLMSFVEPYALKDLLMECTSAIATVGLSTGITPNLTAFSQILLILLMYVGRVGVFTSLMALAAKKQKPPVQRPDGKILIG